MNLYNLVNRRFEITDGNRVSWYGDPFDAKLDVKAIYKVEPLHQDLWRQHFPALMHRPKINLTSIAFYVYLNIDGELMAPKISFSLDMPENEQGSIGGQVYGRVQQINQQEAS